MNDAQPRVVALLFGGLDRFGGCRAAPALVGEGGERRVLPGGRFRQRMIRGERHELRAKERVGARGEDFDLAGVAKRLREREAHQHALRASDPVALHEAHLFGPTIEFVERREQLFGIGGDLEEPLRQFALLDERARTPAAPVDHLLIGEHGHVHRVPVHLRLLAVDDAGFQEIEKQLLLAPVIFGIAGRDLARPVEREPQRFELRPHRCDIRIGPLRGMRAGLRGGVFGGQAERVPPHRMQDVETPGAHEARDHVAHRVIAHMAHVQPPRRIGEHL